MRIKEITRTRVHYGCRRGHVMRTRDGFMDNHKRAGQLYQEQSLPLRYTRPKRSKAAQLRQPGCGFGRQGAGLPARHQARNRSDALVPPPRHCQRNAHGGTPPARPENRQHHRTSQGSHPSHLGSQSPCPQVDASDSICGPQHLCLDHKTTDFRVRRLSDQNGQRLRRHALKQHQAHARSHELPYLCKIELKSPSNM